MGGGDLNLKKSWHPSTMKNMEKVWKAEQQDNEEKKRIAELQREIAMERDQEEMKAYAMNQGVIEKKEDKKLDWMYKGPQESVNREEYLLGRRIDKQFEQMVKSEKETEQNKSSVPKNHVDHDCVPPSLRSFSGNEQVDLARKLQEDPLYAIKKREMEERARLLKNPVKLKQLQQFVSQQKDNSSKYKDGKRKEKHSSDSEVDCDDLDRLLAAKYKKLKGDIDAGNLLKSIKKHKKKSKKSKKIKNRGSSSDSENSSSDEDRKRKKRSKKDKSCARRSRSRSNERRKESRHEHVNYGLMRADGSKIESKKRYRDEVEPESKPEKKETKWVPPKKQRLTEEEKEKKRQEMMANASWRDKERARNVKKYEEQEKKELPNKDTFDKDFFQKQMALATEKQTVESRIKSNRNHIQRSNHSMDKNFARR